MKLYISRHAETDWNVLKRTQGMTDIHLNERGRAQALALARTMGDDVGPLAPRPWSRGYDPGDPIDRMVFAARRAVFDWYGLDPVYD